MSIIISPVEEIDQLYIHQLPSGRPVRTQKVIRIDRITLILSETGKLYCDQLRDYAYAPGLWPWTEPMMKALTSLGIITKEQAAAHVRYCKALRDRDQRSNDLEKLEQLAERYNFSLTEEQRSALTSSE